MKTGCHRVSGGTPSCPSLRTAAALLAGALAWLAPSHGATVHAQPSRGAEEREAHALFEQAESLLLSGRFADAAGLLERSLALFAHPATAFNLAIARRGTGDALGAADVLTEISRGTYGQLDAAHRGEAARMLEEATAQIATIQLHLCGGNDVAVRIDGDVWDRFDDCRDLTRRVNPGRHVLAVTGTGRRPLEETLQLTAGQLVELDRTLDTIPNGRLVVRVPDGARVEVPGVGHGVGGLRRSVPAGDYEVRVFLRAGGDPEVRSVTVPGGGTGEVDLRGDGDGVALAVGLTIGIGVAVAAAIAVIAYFLYDPGYAPFQTDGVLPVVMTLRGAF
ncbi:MAG: hypothetical protein AB7S26_16670 [Sandaracinaceae bacterium]